MASSDDDGTVIIIISSATRTAPVTSAVTVHTKESGKEHVIAALESALAKMRE